MKKDINLVPEIFSGDRGENQDFDTQITGPNGEGYNHIQSVYSGRELPHAGKESVTIEFISEEGSRWDYEIFLHKGCCYITKRFIAKII